METVPRGLVREVATMPAVVTALVDEITLTVGIAPAVERRAGMWRVTLENHRVHAEALFTLVNGRTRQASGRLVVDGVEVPAVDTVNELARVFHDPDGTSQNEQPGGPITPRPPSRPITEAPGSVRFVHDRVVRILGTAEPVYSGVTAAGRWVIGVDLAVLSFQLAYQRNGNKWRLATKQPITFIVNGTDFSADIGNDLEQMLTVLKQVYLGDAAGPTQAINAEAGPARTNSVDVRRTTVIRN